MNDIKINTILFYRELNENCNPKKLLEIVRNGVDFNINRRVLEEKDKIKYHINAVEICLLAGTNFVIYNNQQYKKFKYFYFRENSIDLLFKNCPRSTKDVCAFGFSSICSNEDYLKLIIPNEFFVKKFINDIDYFKSEKDIIYDEKHKKIKFKFGRKEIEILICVIIKEKKEELLEKLLQELFKNYDIIRDFKFDEYFKYNNNFILNLLLLYKNKIAFSKKNFKSLLIEEKENKSNSIVNFNILDKYSCTCHKKNNETITPLHLACFVNNKNIVKMLLKYGANINIKNNKGETPLAYLCRFYNCYEMIKLLIDYKANIYILDNKKNTALHIFCRIYNRNNEQILKYLIEKGLFKIINNINDNTFTPLMNLCYFTDNYYLISPLLENGADINMTNVNGETALHMACKFARYDMAKVLIENGANINKTDNESNTPLLVSCYKEVDLINTHHLIHYLIEHNADINKANNNGDTSFFMVCCWGSENIINYFIEHGADINIKNKNEKSPLSFAYINNNNIAVNCLIEHGAK